MSSAKKSTPSAPPVAACWQALKGFLAARFQALRRRLKARRQQLAAWLANHTVLLRAVAALVVVLLLIYLWQRTPLLRGAAARLALLGRGLRDYLRPTPTTIIVTSANGHGRGDEKMPVN